MPDSQQLPEGDSSALPRVVHTPRSHALLSEARAQAFDAKRAEWAGRNPQLSYEAYMAGEPCRVCGRAIRGEAARGTDEESIALIDADNAAFRAEHEDCPMGVWKLQDHRVEHCHVCCPFPPLSPEQREEVWALLFQPRVRTVQDAIWRVDLTCGHVDPAASGTVYRVPSTVRCSECEIIRGVVKAERADGQADESVNASGLNADGALEYQPLSDEQWSWIQHIAETESEPRRGRPRTYARTIVDAVLYKIHTRIAWRELPAEFGSWQTASRRYRELVASKQWDEITRTLAERDPLQ